MKIAIPAAGSPCIEKVIHGHVATAPVFVIVDTETNEMKEAPNPSSGKGNDLPNPLGVVKELKVDVLICAGLGEWAVKLIEAAGTKVYLAHGGPVANAIDDFKAGKLLRAAVK